MSHTKESMRNIILRITFLLFGITVLVVAGSGAYTLWVDRQEPKKEGVFAGIQENIRQFAIDNELTDMRDISGPHAAEIRKAFSGVDTGDLGSHWELGVVESIEGHSISVKSERGKVGLFEGDCGHPTPKSYYEVLLDPGDPVAWNTYGDDLVICEGEIITFAEQAN